MNKIDLSKNGRINYFRRKYYRFIFKKRDKLLNKIDINSSMEDKKKVDRYQSELLHLTIKYNINYK